MTQDAGSLQNLRDIVEPTRVSWWPLAPGWWVLITIGTLVILISVVRAIRHWHANAYRRAALRELAATQDVTTIAALLKRTALCAWPRTDVASLSGPEWCGWLERTSGQKLTESTTRILCDGLFHSESNSQNAAELAAFAASWIKRHINSGDA